MYIVDSNLLQDNDKHGGVIQLGYGVAQYGAARSLGCDVAQLGAAWLSVVLRCSVRVRLGSVRVRRGADRMRRDSVECGVAQSAARRLCEAGPSSNLGSPPQRRSSTERKP
jgi:hypothetical protein